MDVALPKVIYAQVSPRSRGTSLFDASVFAGERRITEDTVSQFTSTADAITAACSLLMGAGFTLHEMSYATSTLGVSGTPEAFESMFACDLYARELPVLKSQGQLEPATFVDCRDTREQGLIRTAADTAAGSVIEGVALEQARYYMVDAQAPRKLYWHLRAPEGVAHHCKAERAHLSGVTGAGIKVAMVDSGHYAHPFFVTRDYQVRVVLGPGTDRPGDDEYGHGTAESANLFAIAPDVELTMVKMNRANTIGAFNAAVALNPHIISCSWGSSLEKGPLSAADHALEAAIALAVRQGIIVVCSAGNGHFGFPGQHPDVISAGGAYVDQLGDLHASDYASGFASRIYAGRKVPDLAGLVGLRPRGAYIMLPVPPDSTIDREIAGGGAHPDGDETAPDDGWAAISGTSAAAPQLAGACALIKQVWPQATPREVKEMLVSTARDVTTGGSNPSTGGRRARRKEDLATGTGLVDVDKAVLKAKLRAMRAPVTSMGIRTNMGIRGGVAEAVSVVDTLTGWGPPVLGVAEARYLEERL
ncbi:S8 family serine peptidase [Nonomuraea typhae]|uniref:S8 family serine peptidase n=1 Tax=Nonomuraea typhae TaxID=2603600 RepID=UPI0012FB79FC|nr:S8 family serine peptidase [Nonomuraea typhae]